MTPTIEELARGLTEAESRWVKRLQKVLRECPSDRLGFYTVGDREVFLYNRDKEAEVDAHFNNHNVDFCQAVDQADAYLGSIRFPSIVHSTAG